MTPVRALVVDDDGMNRELLVRLHGTIGITDVHQEGDGRRVVGAVAELDPQLVLLDLHLGDVDGFDVLAELAADRAVVVVTGETGRDVERRAVALGARAVLTKPYDRRAFGAAVEAAISPTS